MKRKTEIERLFQIAVKRAIEINGTTGYRPGDPLDPGTILVLTLFAGMLDLRDKAAAAAAQRAHDSLRWHLAGPRRGARPERALLAVMGPAGTHVARGTRVKWRGDHGDAQIERSFHLAEPAGALGVLDDDSTIDLATQVWDGRLVDHTPSPYQPLRAIRLGIQVPMICRRFPGLSWDGLPAALALRVRNVAALVPGGRQSMRWFYQPGAGARIYVPPQDVPGWRDGVSWIEFALPVRPAQTRHIGRARLNVVAALTPIDPQRHPLTGDALIGFAGVATGKLGCEQLGPSWGAAAEGFDAWRERTRPLLRSAGAAVTADDYRLLLRTRFPSLRVLGIAATRIPRENRMVDAVRVTIAATAPSADAVEFFERSLFLAARVERFLSGRTVLGVAAVVGPPSLIVDARPAPDDVLSLYDDFLIARTEANPPRLTPRADGVVWPAATREELSIGAPAS